MDSLLLTDKLFFCKNCKGIKYNLEDLLFVEESSTNYFCSEACIEKFYAPIIKHFSDKLFKLRQDLNCFEDEILTKLEDPSYVDRMLSDPDEIYLIQNQLGEQIYSYAKHFDYNGEKFSLLALCFVYNKYPSFVLSLTVSQNDYIIGQFKYGQKVESIDDFKKPMQGEFDVDPELIEQIEHKKSTLLAEHLERRQEVDIPFENFDIYMEFVDKTLNEADEIFKTTDRVSESYLTYIKAFDRDGISFFYIVICLQTTVDEENDLVIPVFSFPTIDGKLSEYYRKGEMISGNLRN